MLISQAQILKKSDGFTLIELIVVMFIFSVAVGFAIARFDFFESTKSDNIASLLSADIAILRQEAISDASQRVIEIDILGNTIKSGILDIYTGFQEKKLLFSDDKIVIRDVVINGERFSIAKPLMRIYPSGLIDRTLLHIESEIDGYFTLLIHPLTGKVTLQRGYIEENIAEIFLNQQNNK